MKIGGEEQACQLLGGLGGRVSSKQRHKNRPPPLAQVARILDSDSRDLAILHITTAKLKPRQAFFNIGRRSSRLIGRTDQEISVWHIGDEYADPTQRQLMTQSRRRLFGCEPPHCRGEHGQDDNWQPNEPRRAGIFPAHNAIEEREAGQRIGYRETSYERLLLYPPLRCEPWADRNPKNKPSSPPHPSRVGWHTWISAELKHGIRHQKKADPINDPYNCGDS